MSLQKYAVAAAVAACAVPGVALAQTSTAAPVPVNLNRNIVTIVLIIGVSVVVPLIYVLWKVIPRLRSGELSLSKIEFDWRAELLNKTPKKEKARLAEKKARRAEAMARRAEEGDAGLCEVDAAEGDAQSCYPTGSLPPHNAGVHSAGAGEKRVHVEVFSSGNWREAH